MTQSTTKITISEKNHKIIIIIIFIKKKRKRNCVPHTRVNSSFIWNPMCQPVNGQNSSSRHHHTPTILPYTRRHLSPQVNPSGVKDKITPDSSPLDGTIKPFSLDHSLSRTNIKDGPHPYVG